MKFLPDLFEPLAMLVQTAPTINRQQIEAQSALFGDVELFAASGLR
jgi:hypothetical protein